MSLSPEQRPECQVLGALVDAYHDARSKLEPEFMLNHMPDVIGALIETLRVESLYIYQHEIAAIVLEYKIPETETEYLLTFLENNALYFLANYIKKFVPNLMKANLAALKKIENQTTKLANTIEINPFAFELADMLSMISENDDGDVQFNSEPFYAELSKRVLTDLSSLATIHTDLKKADLAKHLKIGSRGPKGESENVIWLHYMFLYWTQILRRNFKHDPKGINGRERFLSFCESCFSFIHPGARLDVLRNAFSEMERTKRLESG